MSVGYNSLLKPSSPGLLFAEFLLNYRFYFTSSGKFVQIIFPLDSVLGGLYISRNLSSLARPIGI